MPIWRKVDGTISVEINNQGHVAVTTNMTDSDFTLIDTTSEDDYGVGWNPIGTNSFFNFMFETGGPRYLGNVGSQFFPTSSQIYMSAKAYTKPNSGFFRITRYRKFKAPITFIAEIPVNGGGSSGPNAPEDKSEWLIPVLHHLF